MPEGCCMCKVVIKTNEESPIGIPTTQNGHHMLGFDCYIKQMLQNELFFQKNARRFTKSLGPCEEQMSDGAILHRFKVSIKLSMSVLFTWRLYVISE